MKEKKGRNEDAGVTRTDRRMNKKERIRIASTIISIGICPIISIGICFVTGGKSIFIPIIMGISIVLAVISTYFYDKEVDRSFVEACFKSHPLQ